MRTRSVSWRSFILCCFWIFLSFNISVVSGMCLEDQKSLLLQLKNNLNFSESNSRKLVHWDQSLSCSNWIGVSWDEQGHVTGLDLSAESISGGFDSSSYIFSLQYLQMLNLAFNNFNSEIPTEIGELKNLTYLNLSYAGFAGQIPIEISNLTRLVTLDISSYSFLTGQQLKLENPSLRMLIQNLTSIRQLYLDGVNISAKGEEWCSALLSLPSLQELSMSDCNLVGPIDSLAKLEHLSVIHLDMNRLSSQVPKTLAKLENLTTLSLASCNLRGTFPHNIFKLGTLYFIDISNNKDLHGPLPDFPRNASLKTLIVSETSFSGPMPNSIGNLKQLTELDLSYCQLNGTLPISISSLSQLVHLDLSHNRFTGPIPSFNKCKELIRGILSSNYFNSSLSSTHFEGLLNLVDIHLTNNSITGRIPSSMFMLPSVRNILLSHNQFDGQLDGIVNFSRVQSLDLSNNHLEGPIPPSLFELRELRVLQLSFNKFSSEIEINMIQKLGNLTELDLSYNNLSIIDANTTFPSFPSIASLSLASCNLITFPKLLQNQSELLFHLDLSNNHLTGSIPHWLSSPFLVELNISYNYLTYWEDPRLNNMSNLLVLDLHFNYLQGSLPALPPEIVYLDYSSNNMGSLIPPNIGNYLSSTLFLSFSSNNLHGNIPKSICNAPSLEVLDLSNNYLSGEIPTEITYLSFLSFLNFSYNHLVGKIPTGAQIQTFDASSFIGNEGLCGPPLTQNCSSDGMQGMWRKNSIDWSFLSVELGFVFGIGIVLWPLVFWKRWRIRYWKRVDELLYQIFPQLDFVYQCREGKKYRTLRWMSH